MGRLAVFNSVTLDGYFTGENGDLSWAYEGGDDPEFAAYTRSNARGGGALVLGRVTHDMMKSFWPTDAARQTMPEIAAAMNRYDKIVFSRTLDHSDWENTRVVNNDPVDEIRRIKLEDGRDLTILGSGSIVAQLAGAGLIDTFQFVVCPVALGAGRTLFEGLTNRVPLKLIGSRAFANGKIVADYELAR
jgi:dihydrofolate reductase